MTMDRTFSRVSDTELRLDTRMLYYCLRLDNSKLSLEQVSDFIYGESVPITIGDAAKILGYHNVTINHILRDSGYSICTELIRAMVLCMRGTLGLIGDVLHITDALVYELNLAIKTSDPLEKAARIYTAITKHEAAKEHSKAIGYLMMLYSLKKDGYGLFVPDDDFISKLLENNSTCSDDIIKHLKTYYPEITDEFVEKAIDFARTPMMLWLL